MDFNPYDRELHRNPYPVYRKLRDDHPVHHNSKLHFWTLSRFDDVHAALKAPEVFSSADGIAVGTPSDLVRRLPMMITMDPPRHTHLRALVNRAFTPRRIAELEVRIREIAAELVGTFIERGECDVVRDFSGPLPTTVIAELLGVPVEDREFFKERSTALVQSNIGEALEREQELDLSPAIDLAMYLKKVYDERRSAPRDDLMSALLAATVDGESLNETELIGFAFLLLVAGNETTTNLISNAVLLLELYPDARARLVSEPTLLPIAVEEFLRFDSPVQGLARTTTRDVEIHDSTIVAGERVLLLFGSANRDERHFDRPDHLDVARDPNHHLAFGFGTHFCLGASLARLEARVAFETILSRLPDYSVNASGVERLHSGPIRGLSRLPIEFSPSGRSRLAGMG